MIDLGSILAYIFPVHPNPIGHFGHWEGHPLQPSESEATGPAFSVEETQAAIHPELAQRVLCYQDPRGVRVDEAW